MVRMFANCNLDFSPVLKSVHITSDKIHVIYNDTTGTEGPSPASQNAPKYIVSTLNK